jgi:hypothetical protein
VSATDNNPRLAGGRQFISYMDLSGGLNTKRDVHAIERNELGLSQNTWYGTENAVSKRPGTTAVFTSSGATGTSVHGTGLATARFNGTTYIIAQQGSTLLYAGGASTTWTSFASIGTSTVRIHTAQMYDPMTSANALFICDGVDTPRYWTGPPATSVVAVSFTTAGGYLPSVYAGGSGISPRFVICDGQNSNLVYAGEPTFPNAVYVSDPFYPEKFSFSATNTTPYGGSYAPYIIGQNDGVNGGDITGLCKLGQTIVVFKQTAIYFMQLQSVYGDLVFTSFCVSASTGCAAPESIVAFDQFACFLGIDGAYTIDIYGNIQQITKNVPTFFDNSLTGFAAACTSPLTAVGVRNGARYLLFYDAANAGYPTNGLWFDFAKPDKNGLPTVGEILGYSPCAAVALRSPGDDGNFVWSDATMDRIGKFGLGFSDFGGPITVKLAIKADIMTDIYGPKAPAVQKALVNMWLDVSVPQYQSGSIQFYGNVTRDSLNVTQQAASPINVNVGAPGGSAWGYSYWGVGHWTATGTDGTPPAQYVTARRPGLQADQGYELQLGLTETGTLPWTLLGITGEYDDKGVTN